MNVKEEVNKILMEDFELESSALTDDANLFNDLNLDSLDAADMLVVLEETIGQKIDGNKFLQVRTLSDVYKTIDEIVNQAS